jgi:transcription elongation factor
LSSIAASTSAIPFEFQTGDRVEVTGGEMVRLQGVIESITDDIAVVRPTANQGVSVGFISALSLFLFNPQDVDLFYFQLSSQSAS